MSNRAKKPSRKSFMQTITNRHLATHGGGAVDPDDVFKWAQEQGLWEPPQKTERQMFREEFARANREETILDAQGREVRRKHAVIKIKNGQQQVLWADLTDAPEPHMRLSFQQRRRGIGGDVKKLKDDIDSWNDNNAEKKTIQMSFNFDADHADDQHPGEYDDNPPDEFGDIG
jgi:hypothetical protein